MNAKKTATDWPAIEAEYRAGKQSIRAIAEWFQISDTAIRKEAKKRKWVRANQPSGSQDLAGANRPAVAAPIAEVSKVEEVLGRGRNLAERMLDELGAETLHRGEMETIIELSETDPDRLQALRQAVSLPVRAKTLQTIALALKTMGETVSEQPKGKKATQKSAADAATAPGGKFAPRPGPPQLSVVGK
ncbi:hypothetical protein [Devosia sp. SL43]|uniref:hypothetical protein n=1 Tax=Devosia sp. SL43 TaxID=2806348 RepID=UPI001F22D4DD|nr:hypothetical protein [Devosia sp. SL43]